MLEWTDPNACREYGRRHRISHGSQQWCSGIPDDGVANRAVMVFAASPLPARRALGEIPRPTALSRCPPMTCLPPDWP
jgi:hypothetical protein